MIHEVHQNLTLLQCLKKLSLHSNREIKNRLQSGFCKVNTKVERFGSTRLKVGDLVEFVFETKEDVSINIPIIHENEHYYVLNKPIDLECSEKILRSYFPLAKLVHRLDKPTSGVFLLAKSDHAQKELSQLFKQKKIKKTYLAFVDRVVKQDEGEISSYLVRKGFFHGQTIWGSNPLKRGLFASTSWEFVERKSDYSILRCFPKTGRTHQIRVHLKEMGHPILGDFQYCRDFQSTFVMKRLYLHAEQIAFRCPFTLKDVKFSAELP